MPSPKVTDSPPRDHSRLLRQEENSAYLVEAQVFPRPGELPDADQPHRLNVVAGVRGKDQVRIDHEIGGACDKEEPARAKTRRAGLGDRRFRNLLGIDLLVGIGCDCLHRLDCDLDLVE